MSARGARDSSLFLSILLSDVARIGGPEACDVLSHWTRLPATDAFSPQDALEAFVVSHESLARLKCNLPESSDATAGAASLALRACGTILYWLNRPDLQEGERRAACRNSLQELSIHEKGAALNAIQECTLSWWRLSERPNGEVENVSIAHFFPQETTEICRRALHRPEIQIGFFRHYFESDRQRALSFALSVLQKLGNTADLPLLRRLSEDSNLGRDAVKAIESIETRLGPS
jgi:hypothetical protein